MEKQIVSFEINNQKYGIDILNIEEIIKIPEITTIITELTEVKGVINLRGKVIPIIDLREKLYNKSFEINKFKNRIVICDIEYNEKIIDCGFIVDKVDNVLTLNESNITDTKNILNEHLVDNIVKLENEKLLIILNVLNIINEYEDL